jgi:hypothetical protein
LKKFNRICVYLFFITTAAVFAGPPDEINARKKYYIKTIEFDIEGRTKTSALIKAADIKTGEEFTSEEELNVYIGEKKQLLINNRVLAEVTIEWTAEDESSGVTGVTLVVRTVDTRNFIILPEPKYSSNKGFEPALKLRDYNFLGAMNPLKIDLGYSMDEYHINDASKSKYSLEAEIDYPFEAFGFNWNFYFAPGAAYVKDEAPSFNNVTGISIDIPLRNTTATFGYNHGAVIGEEYYLFEKQRHDEIFEDIKYMYSKVYGLWKAPLGIKLPFSGELNFVPKLSGAVNYRLAGGGLDYRRGPAISFGQATGAEKINWYGNFRDGAAIFLENNHEYNFYFNEWNNNAAAGTVFHKKYISFAGVSARFRYKQWFNRAEHYRDESRAEAADMLRGILDRSIYADYMLSLNIDLTLSVFTFKPSVWFANKSFRYFDFELFTAPVIDIAMVDGKRLDYYGKSLETLEFGDSGFFVSGGLEALVFPLSWRSIFLRLSVAWNVREALKIKYLPSGENREIYIGIGHYY